MCLYTSLNYHELDSAVNERSEQNVKDVWEIGGAYEAYMGRRSRLVAVEFLR